MKPPKPKYRIEKTNGNPVDEDAVYLVLRLDNDYGALKAAEKWHRSIKDQLVAQEVGKWIELGKEAWGRKQVCTNQRYTWIQPGVIARFAAGFKRDPENEGSVLIDLRLIECKILTAPYKKFGNTSWFCDVEVIGGDEGANIGYQHPIKCGNLRRTDLDES